MNRAIKDVITEFPEVGDILAEYDVGCVTCQVGTCLLKDIVAIHNLPPETEQALMLRIAAVVSPGERIEFPPAGLTAATPRAASSAAGQPKYSPPMRALVGEHVLIKRWVALIPAVLRVVDVDAAEDRQLLMDGVDFIRSYADRFHHAKEEDILFEYFDESQEIIQAMLADHETARSHVRRLAEAIEQRDGATMAQHLGAYGELLSAHIKKEDEILYPWMDRELTTAQVGELFSRFAAVDEAAGRGFTECYERAVDHIDEIVTSRMVIQTSEVGR